MGSPGSWWRGRTATTPKDDPKPAAREDANAPLQTPLWRELDLAARRHAVAEWRDRQILAVDDLFNHEAARARDAFDQELAAAPREATFNVGAYAATRIDALLATALSDSFPRLMAAASEELAGVDARLAEVARTLVGETSIPAPAPQPVEAEDDGVSPETAPAPRKLDPARVVSKAAALADGAANAADGLIREPLRVRPRLREAAARRVAEHWMRLSGEPASILAQAIARLDAVAQESRTRLS